MDFGSRLFGQSLEAKPTVVAQAAKPGLGQDQGHAHPQPESHAHAQPQPGSHAPSGLGQAAPIIGLSKKRKSGPAVGRMGFLNPQFKGHAVGSNAPLAPAMITQVGGHDKAKGHAHGGHTPLVPAMVTQVGDARPKYKASKLSRKGYRLSSQGEGHAHFEGHHAQEEGCHAQDAQLQGYVDSGT